MRVNCHPIVWSFHLNQFKDIYSIHLSSLLAAIIVHTHSRKLKHSCNKNASNAPTQRLDSAVGVEFFTLLYQVCNYSHLCFAIVDCSAQNAQNATKVSTRKTTSWELRIKYFIWIVFDALPVVSNWLEAKNSR